MKTTKSIIATLLAAVMLFGGLSITAFAQLPPLTDVTWNDDLSADFSFDGAEKYTYSVYINKIMVWGFGSTKENHIPRDKMVPYVTALAQEAVSRYGYTGDVSFDLKIIAKNRNDENITDTATVSKTLNIDDVIAGKLSPSDEMWQHYRVSTADKSKLSQAIHAAYDPDKSEISASIAASGLSYETYINAVISSAGESEYYTFKGTLARCLRFGKIYNESAAYTNISLVDNNKKISEVNITIAAPVHGQSVAKYAASGAITTSTEGVKVKFHFDNNETYEVDTKTRCSKFYSGNSYDIAFLVSFENGYVPAENFTVKVNGEKAYWVNDSQSAVSTFGGYHCISKMTADGNIFQNIITFFHNVFTRIKYPNGMPY